MLRYVDGVPFEMTAEEIEAFEASRAPPPPGVGDYQRAIEAHVEAVARQRGYSTAASCAGYVSSTVTAWAAEAAAFISWRDQVWLEIFEALAAVQAGGAAPTIEAVLAALPAIVWPA